MSCVDEAKKGIVHLTSGGFQNAASLLTQAFINDPLYTAVLPDAGRRQKALMWLHERVIQYCAFYGIIHTLPSMEGVACWLPPGQTEITLTRIVKTGLFAMPYYLGLFPFFRFNSYMNVSDALRKKHAPEAFWYLWVLGVDPSSQGHGFGNKLIQPILERADSERTACYLETENKQNLGFYETLGFQEVASETVPKTSITTWSLLRESK
jgi:ribosomal protein S18 acetylase RimI-like enzyme